MAQIKVAGLPVASDAQQSALAKSIEQKVTDYKLVVQKTDKSTQEFGLVETGLNVNYDKSAAAAIQAKENDSWWRNLQWWRDRNVPLTIETKRVAYDNFIKTKLTQTTKPYKNAVIVVDKGQVSISPATAGQGNTVDNPQTAVRDRAKYLNSRPLVQRQTEIEPVITADNLASSKSKAESLMQGKVSFALAGKTFTPSANDVSGWITVQANETKHTDDISIDKQAVINYLNSIAAPYVKPAHTALVANENGTSVTLVPGVNGTDVADKDAVATQIASDLSAGNTVNQNLEIKDSAYATTVANADSKWLAVDLNTKQLYAVEHQKIVQTFAVSAGAPTTPTVTGKSAIYQKFTKQDMTGANADGSDYSQPNVEWINYFYKDYAVHGNYWRPDNYFGNINSSHGCVGLRNSDAKWIYDWSSIGTPVRVYN